ncbi:MAG: MauE/DoxX family redox-associated membrane protein [Phycisphaerae bacterium]
MRLWLFILRLVLAGVFLWFGGTKLYALIMQHHSTLPTMFDYYLGTTGPWRFVACGVEIMLGLWLLIGWFRHLVVWTTFLVLLAFTGLIAWELQKADPLPCGCGATPAVFREVVEGGKKWLVPEWPPKARDVRPIRIALGWSLARNVALLLVTGMIIDGMRRKRGG